MANAQVVSMQSNEISSNFRSKTFALKWPEESDKSSTPIAVNLSVDPKGFYLICLNKMSKEVECFDLVLIHDTRTGAQVALPRGADTCDRYNIGIRDVPLVSKWLTIAYGNSFVANRALRLIHFCFDSPATAREWTEQLFRAGHQLRLRNLSSLECLEKIHSRIIHGLAQTRSDDKHILVQNLIQFLCTNNRDTQKEAKILQALEHLQLPHRPTALLDPDHFPFATFFRFYMYLMNRREVEKVFHSSVDNFRRELQWEGLRVFMEKQDGIYGDPLGSESYEQKAKELMSKYHQDIDRGMSEEAFLRYLLSFENLAIDPTKLELFMDMDQPLSHYFISSSHNTYLTGSQFTGRANVEMYRQVLLTGCRCIELDVVDSERIPDEPEIKHKNTPVRTVPFIDVIVAIRDYAFKVTPYPLTLSLENHCTAGAQAKMAKYLIDVFDESLLSEPLKSHPCDEVHSLPSPNDLKYKILIKNRKLDSKSASKTPASQRKNSSLYTTSSGDSPDVTPLTRREISSMKSSSTNSSNESATSQRKYQKNTASSELKLFASIDRPCQGVLGESSSDEEPAAPIPALTGEALPESQATKAMSDLVHYTVPVRFLSFEHAESRHRSHEMSSFSEDKAHYWLREHSKRFLWYNQRQLTRVYPRGTRFDSSNYFPHPFWSVGCQMIALNYQTLDIPMQLNLGLFSLNGSCGYLQKPSVLRLPRDSFDPKTRTSVENVAALQITLTLLSGQFLCQEREPTFVDIKMYGIEADGSKRHEGRVRIKEWNGFQAIYATDVNQVTIRFARVILPEMAAIRLAVLEDDGTLIGQCFLPVAYLRPGYRHLVLRNPMNLPVHSSSLFVYVRRSIDVDADDQKIVNRLTAPLSSQAREDKSSSSPLEISSNFAVRIHHRVEDEPRERNRTRETANFTDETNWYQKHLLAASLLHDRKNLCRFLPLPEFEHKTTYQDERNGLKEKIRRLSTEYQKKIQHEEERLQKTLARQRSASLPSFPDTRPNKDIEQSLLELYRKKFRQQEEAECKSIKEYYNKLEKDVTVEYRRQIEAISAILKSERARVNEHVQAQIKNEISALARNAGEREKERITQSNVRVGINIIGTLTEMHQRLFEVIQLNLQSTLEQLAEQRKLEIERSRATYSCRFRQTQLRFQRETDEDEDEDEEPSSNPSAPLSCRLLSVSMIQPSTPL